MCFSLLKNVCNDRQKTWAKYENYFTILLLFWFFPSSASLGRLSKITSQRAKVSICSDGWRAKAIYRQCLPSALPLVLKGGFTWIGDERNICILVTGPHKAQVRRHAHQTRCHHSVLGNHFIWSQASTSNSLVLILLFAYSIAAADLLKDVKTGSSQSFPKKLENCVSCVAGPLFKHHTLSKGIFALHQANNMVIAS